MVGASCPATGTALGETVAAADRGLGAAGRAEYAAADRSIVAAGRVAIAAADRGEGAAGRVEYAAADRGLGAAGRVVSAAADRGSGAAGRVAIAAADRGVLAADRVVETSHEAAEAFVVVPVAQDEVVAAGADVALALSIARNIVADCQVAQARRVAGEAAAVYDVDVDAREREVGASEGQWCGQGLQLAEVGGVCGDVGGVCGDVGFVSRLPAFQVGDGVALARDRVALARDRVALARDGALERVDLGDQRRQVDAGALGLRRADVGERQCAQRREDAGGDEAKRPGRAVQRRNGGEHECVPLKSESKFARSGRLISGDARPAATGVVQPSAKAQHG